MLYICPLIVCLFFWLYSKLPLEHNKDTLILKWVFMASTWNHSEHKGYDCSLGSKSHLMKALRARGQTCLVLCDTNSISGQNYKNFMTDTKQCLAPGLWGRETVHFSTRQWPETSCPNESPDFKTMKLWRDLKMWGHRHLPSWQSLRGLWGKVWFSEQNPGVKHFLLPQDNQKLQKNQTGSEKKWLVALNAFCKWRDWHFPSNNNVFPLFKRIDGQKKAILSIETYNYKQTAKAERVWIWSEATAHEKQ